MASAKWRLQSKPAAAAAARKNSSGIFSSRPQPSPVRPSASTAPRCVSRSSAPTAVHTRSWLASPSICAIRPKPQLSRSNSGR